jgi:hypothetical protein
MRIGKGCITAAVLTLSLAIWPKAAPAQDIVQEAMSSFPVGTVRVEYSSPAKLRALPNYATLSQRYTGQGIRKLEEDLAKLGIQQEEINELVIGWQAQGAEMSLEGVAQGRFDPKSTSERAAAQGLAASPLGKTSAYCFGAEAGGNCVAIFSDSLGAFGSLDSLAAMIKTRDGETPNAGSDSTFAKHVEEARSDAAIWGVSVGPAIADWFKGWMPNQSNVQLDWKQTFKGVDVLRYNVQTTDKVYLAVKLDCTSSQTASSLTQVFQGLKLVQQMAWQTQNPNAPNPFQSLAVDRSDRQVQLNMTTPYSALEAGGMPGR